MKFVDRKGKEIELEHSVFINLPYNSKLSLKKDDKKVEEVKTVPRVRKVKKVRTIRKGDE